MKKIISLSLALIFILAMMSVSVFAATLSPEGPGGSDPAAGSPLTEGEEAADDLIAPAEEEQQKGFQWNSGVLIGVLMVLFGTFMIVAAVIDTKKKQASGKAKKPAPDSPLLRK